MPPSKQKIRSSLQKKRFQEDKSGHHIVYEYQTTDGNLSGISTYMSHGKKPKDMPKNIFGKMAKQCKLNYIEFDRFIDCGIDQNEYENKVKKYFSKK